MSAPGNGEDVAFPAVDHVRCSDREAGGRRGGVIDPFDLNAVSIAAAGEPDPRRRRRRGPVGVLRRTVVFVTFGREARRREQIAVVRAGVVGVDAAVGGKPVAAAALPVAQGGESLGRALVKRAGTT